MSLQTQLRTYQPQARFIIEEGWEVPDDFGDWEAEYEAVANEAAVFDRSHCGKIEVSGPEAARFLHNLCTNDVLGLKPASGCEAYLTTGQAKILGCAAIYYQPMADGSPSYWLDVGPGMGPKVAAHLNRHWISERIELVDRTAELSQVHIAGPMASSVLERTFGKSVTINADLEIRVEHFDALPCSVRRRDFIGFPGYDLGLPADSERLIWTALVHAGAKPAGLHAFHMRRIEVGMPQYGLDVDETNLPQEVGRIEKTVSFTKGCYIGQETVARIRTYGHVNRSLVLLKVTGNASVPSESLVSRDTQEIGATRSWTYFPSQNKTLAFAYLRRGHEKPGTIVEIAAPSGRLAAEVIGLPLSGSP
jgi:folate-binding protein YgfZ